MPLDAQQLLAKSREELDQLYAASAAGKIPHGEAAGTAVICPGTWTGRILACLVRCLWWQGKVIDAAHGFLLNRITFFSVCAIRAKVYKAASWVDNQPTIVLDYSQTSWVARKIRDEIREVEPGLFLGKVWWGKKPLVHFVLSYRYEAPSRVGRRFWATLATLGLALVLYLACRFTSDRPVVYPDSDIDHFKYGSTGGERSSGIPLSIWNLMPDLFPENLPGAGLASLGFIYEENHALPIGVSQREVLGVQRVFLNCAVCHVGTYRMTPTSPRQVVVGMPANTVDLQGFERFLFESAVDEKFSSDRISAEIKERGSEDCINLALIRYAAVYMMREQILLLRQRFKFMDREPDCGPGRVDTWNPPKVLLNFPMEKLPEREWVGNCDFPSIWYQKEREGMDLHWDGNNSRVDERNRSAAFGTGARPTTLDRESMDRLVEFLKSPANKPPDYPGARDAQRALRGQQVYEEYCMSCHGRNGTDFTGEFVGRVTSIDKINTDRHRLDSYSAEMCANQNLLYAGYPSERFSHFHKTNGYANQPLDGIWLRAPYLHNGSVPTLRELLDPKSKRRSKFFRGYDVYDQVRMGFVADKSEEAGRTFFEFDTSKPGNDNGGHEGRAYGTELPDADKDALVEYLKTF